MDINAILIRSAKCVKSESNNIIFVEKGYKYVICVSCYIKIFVDIFERYVKVRSLHVIKTSTGFIYPYCKICARVLLSFNECNKCEKCLALLHQYTIEVIENGVTDVNNPVFMPW